MWRLGILRPDGAGKTIDYTRDHAAVAARAAQAVESPAAGIAHVGILQLGVRVAVELSNVLALRGDRGEDPSALGRQDAVDFLVHLRARELQGAISNHHHRICVAASGRFCARRASAGCIDGLARLRGSSDEFAFFDADGPRAAARDPEGEPERALPQVVIDQLLAPAAIALLHETAGEALACAVELQMRTGRRPQEIAHVPFKCLEHEQRVREDGKLESCRCSSTGRRSGPKTRKELPIFAEERRLIKRMQRVARERFPDADPDRLPLLPRQCATATADAALARDAGGEDARVG